jgi:hypothetical protein
MQGETNERWFELCGQAAIAGDPDYLLELTREIVRILVEKDRRLRASTSKRPTAA